jgi:alkylation response protein AidB-like acyl-CoA dehydrogenase
MNFNLSPDRQILQDTVRRFIASSCGFDKRARIQAGAEGFSRANWAQFAELGLLGIPFSEAEGGLGGSAIDVAIVMSELGRGLALEPFFAVVVLAGGILRHGASDAQRAALIPDIVSGQSIGCFAYAEEGSRYNLADVRLTARKQAGEGYVLNGVKLAVSAAPAADWIIVSARTAGERRDANDITLFHVSANAPGLSRRDYVAIDGALVSDITFENVPVAEADVIGPVGGGFAIAQRVADEATAALCAEALGAMTALNDATLEYSRQRRAFGQTISKFQVIQHRLVNMKIATEQANALAVDATCSLSERRVEASRLISAAKAKVGKESRYVAQSAVQLHGGIGVTDELDVGHHMKRLLAIEASFGDTAHHLQRFDAQRPALRFAG